MGDSAQLSAASAPKRYALPTDWDQHKETIRRLYLDENEPLKEVMAIMGRDYGHFGSIKQYKNKLREWGFDTKYKRQQPSQKRKYKRPSRQSVDAIRAVDYLSNAPSVEDDDDRACQAAFAQGTSTLSATRQVSTDFNEGRQASHRHRTYRASSCAVGIQVGRSATPPMSLPERIFSLAQQHIETSFTYEVWKVVDGNVQTITARTKEELELPESDFDLVRSAVLLFEQGSTVDGCHVLSKAFALVRPILKNGNVRALNFFWSSLVFLVQSNRTDILVHLISYIYEMATILLQRGHPVAQMFKLLTQIDVLELEHVVHNAWQMTTDAFQKQLPNLHPEYVRHQCDLIFRIYGKRDALTAERRLCQLLKNCEDTAQTLEISHLTVLNALGYNFMNSKDWVKAVNIGQKLEERAQLAQDIDLLVYQIGGMEIQARAFNELKLTMPAVKCLKQATRLIADEWGKTDPWRIELMALQQLYLREGGEIKEAADLQAEISRITERIDADWDAQN
ncbi:uncharacterized protein BBA_09101 [Beauveria bassiana ARSEF 2860]|uniref:Clr5 domain-containing protein n=1 Tax=Beauveria bassiana (strain ARSEF 2860) TaxID=655819 RepID=J4VTS8_BEAB2|nr:uncharacterized protein BBA_09101 [Beauveria bassiana ARSEF 2860]EJP61945.1 hypothetical protein BBA_09101 [Beauveria bassiana ARSEF 2860]